MDLVGTLQRQFGNEPSQVIESVCACGGKRFRVQLIEDEGAVRRTCLDCGTAAFMADSEEHWHDDGEIATCECPCGGEEFAAALGLMLRDDGDVRWVAIGLQCLACEESHSYEDWKIDYSPTVHLQDMA